VGQQQALKPSSPDLYVAALGEEGQRQAFLWICRWCDQGIWAEMDYGGRSLKSQMKRANKFGAEFVMIIGDNEIENGAVVLRNMKTKNQVRIELDKIEEKVPEAISKR
jgi:histidyl-tRNA synthetase